MTSKGLSTMIQCVKRKSSNLKTIENESEDSDYEETLPSVKRQRISMGAMQRLFARFTLNDEPSTNKTESPSSSNNNSSKTKASFCENKFRLFGGNSNAVNRNNNENSAPNRNGVLGPSVEGSKTPCSRHSCGNKRHVDEETDTTPDRATPQQKRVRHLKRGLRLCSSITCYIEQIIYN